MKPRSLVWILWMAALASTIAVASASPSPTPTPSPSASPLPVVHQIDEDIPGLKSVYGPPLLKLLKNWPIEGLITDMDPKELPGRFVGIRKKDDSLYVAVQKQMIIDAPMDTVVAIVDDVAHYQKLYPDFIQVKVLAEETNMRDISWEKPSPVFFVPNIRYTLRFLMDRSIPGRVMFRYQLTASNRLKHIDGIMVIESLGPKKTRESGYDIFLADFGPVAGIVSSKQVWRDAMGGYFLSDYSVKLKAEHPEMSYDEIAKERKKILEKFTVEPLHYEVGNPLLDPGKDLPGKNWPGKD